MFIVSLQKIDFKNACFDPDLMWNEVGASGGIALLGMLEKNHSLTELGLAGNSIPCQLLGQIGVIPRFLECLLIFLLYNVNDPFFFFFFFFLFFSS